MITRILSILGLTIVIGFAGIWLLGRGWLVTPHGPGTVTVEPIPPSLINSRSQAQRSAAKGIGVANPDQIVFGDLHVHTTYSFDAFMMSLPLAGGDGAHPIADACDFARYCSELDFWSINDHALASTPERWEKTVDSIRQCNAVSGDSGEPDMVSYLGWEWTQVGNSPAKHYGHKNVILRDLEDDRIPARPIAALPPTDRIADIPTFGLGAYAAAKAGSGGMELARYLQDTGRVPACPGDVPVRDLPLDCREQAGTPAELFAKLDDWGHEALVIPHGTAWGFYTPLGSSWDKQLTAEQHDPDRQRLVEVFSGHGNSEEYRDWSEITFEAGGGSSCPGPTKNYEPSCWRAGEIIRERCISAGEEAEECEQRAVQARQHFVDADLNGGASTVPDASIQDWLEAGQCTDCFQPAFNYRPKNSVQYMMALGRKTPSGDPLRFRFGFMASSDNHSARPGTGYKEVARSEFTEARFSHFSDTPLGGKPDEEPEAHSNPWDPERAQALFGVWEAERQASFFLNGGLVAVHTPARDRESIYAAMSQKRVYGTSGPRILLWFDLLNAPKTKDRLSMGGETRMKEAPIFEARAVGSFEQKPGCPDYATSALSPERLQRLCQGECYNPSDRRRQISRIEVVRVRPQLNPNERVETLIEDPWRVFECSDDLSGCRVVFTDDEFRSAGRDALYYARAIEVPSPAVDADPLRCERDAEGRCLTVRPCMDEAVEDECLSSTEERAWSSPIFVDFER